MNTQWRAQASAQGLDLPVGEQLHEHLKQAASLRSEYTQDALEAHLNRTPAEHAEHIIERLQEQRATWKRTHINAEMQRYFRDITFGAGVDQTTVEQTTTAVIDQSIALNDFGQPKHLPEAKLRADGTSVYRRADYELFTSTGVIEAEQNIITAASTDKVIPVAAAETFAAQRDKHLADGKPLSATQADMARAFVTDERLLVVGIGPAGAGKTSSTQLTVNTVHASGGRVVGVAPTAAAAAVMGDELGINADTIASFLGGDPAKQLRPGDMLLVDEIGMVSTPQLSQLVEAARESGAVVRGIGDYRQLAAVGSGGALRLIEREAGAVHLEDVFRFKNADEAAASLQLRETPLVGEDKPFAWYLDNDRITAGGKDGMLADAFAGWAQDTATGKQSVMIASNNADVAQLNDYAQTAQIDAGVVDTTQAGVTLSNQSQAYVGDVVVTRRNDRQNRVNQGKDFVKNGDLWNVRAVNDDGSLVVGNTYHEGVTTLPAAYVREHVELGYASTIYRVQGATVDTTHAVIDASTDRASAYVALSRGRESNRAYVATGDGQNRDDVLATVAANFDRNLSAHEETAAQRAADRNIAARLDRYDDLSVYASDEAMKRVAIKALGKDAPEIYHAEGWGALAHELADTYTAVYDPVVTLRRAYDMHELDTANDPAAVLQWRVAGLREKDAQHRARFGENARPLAYLPDEKLDAYIEAARKRATPVEDIEIEDTKWATRDYALVKTDQLREMLTRTNTALAANEFKNPREAAEIAENMQLMQAEAARRRWASPEQKHVEAVMRGEKPRTGAHEVSLLRSLEWEKSVREDVLLPQVQSPQADPEKIAHGISGFSADTTWQRETRFTPVAIQDALRAEHRQLSQLVQTRGAQIAAEMPVWAEGLGAVPENPRNAQHWYRVAAEVEAFREKYNVPATDPQTVPKSLIRPGNRGEFLAAQVVDVHKRSELSRTVKTPEANAVAASTEELLARGREQQSAAEARLGMAGIAQAVAQPEAEAVDEVTQLWAQVEDAYTKEQQAKDVLDTATDTLGQASGNYEQAVSARDDRAEELMSEMVADYAPVQAAQEQVKDANIFNRGGRQRELDAAQQAFTEKYGVATPPAKSENQEWMMNDQEFAAAQARVEQTEPPMVAARAEVETARSKYEATHGARHDAYAKYSQARDGHPATAIVGEGMTDAQVRQLRAGRARIDEKLLASGKRPEFEQQPKQGQRRGRPESRRGPSDSSFEQIKQQVAQRKAKAAQRHTDDLRWPQDDAKREPTRGLGR